MEMKLSDKFLDQYDGFPEHMTAYSKFVYLRTYSRWLPEEKRRETWKETCKRAVEYNCSLVEGTTQQEAEDLFDNMFHLRQFLSGRTLWIGGTEAAKKYPMANFNCSFVVMDDFEAIDDLFYLLMVGTGVGFRILQSDVAKFPKVRDNLQLIHAPYNATPKHARTDHTSIVFTGNVAEIKVGDSKEGWVQALSLYFKLFWNKDYRSIEAVIINYNDVRPKGERLKTFGGTASGHASLKVMFEKIHDVLTTDRFTMKPKEGQLRPIHLLDICNIIGQNVVIGGVRRTSEIALLDAKDDETIVAKQNLWQYPDKSHRYMSNNSIFYEEKPTWERLKWQFDVLENEGEPCFVNAEAARKRRPNFQGVNPCVEILLDSRGLCNLTTINMMSFVNEGRLDLAGVLEAQKLSARAGYRMTNVDLELYKWDAIQKRDRLIGCSVTGWKDAMEALGCSEEEEQRLQQQMRDAARQAANEYADSLGTPRSLLTTAVKPEGTISQVAGGVSSGLHHTHSPYFIRRVRINSTDPLCKVAEELGWSVHNEVGQGISITDESGMKRYIPVDTKVIEFPISSPVTRTKYDVSAIEQLNTYYSFQDNYTEHNSSNTISVKDGEWETVADNIYTNWDEMVAVSFLKLDGHSYDLAPYESITKEKYEEMKANMKPFDYRLLEQFEDVGEDFELEDEECVTGACPVR